MYRFIELEKYCKDNGVGFDEQTSEKFYKFMNMLIEKNKVMNLTAITDQSEIEIKHFIDSLAAAPEIIRISKEEELDDISVVDIGTGAGFPGLPLKLVLPEVNFTLADSLNKRITFIDEVVKELKLKKIRTIAVRAEDFGQGPEREKYDFCVSRAVAGMSVLLEYVLPLVKVGGYALLYKSGSIEEEIHNALKALDELGGEIIKVKKFRIPDTDMSRSLVLVKKGKATPDKYPRRSGKPSKSPIK